jgi:hypothetical protein
MRPYQDPGGYFVNNLHPVFKSRSFGETLQITGFGFTVESCRWSAEGGPSEAVLNSWAKNPLNIDQLLALVRCPVELWSDAGQLSWWGLVYGFEIQDGAAHVSVSLDQLENRVRVAYGENIPESLGGSRRATTGWADNAISQATYGVKESQLALNQVTQSQAEAWRAVRLLERGRLVLQPEISGRVWDIARITLHCRGWWSTLSWRQYDAPAALVQNVVTEPHVLYSGGRATWQYWAQSFVPASSWSTNDAWFYLIKIGTPVFNLYAAIYSNSGGSPNANLGSSAAVAIAGLPTKNPEWFKFVWSSPVALTSGTTYWLVLWDDGAHPAYDTYRFVTDQLGLFTGGIIKYWDGGAWNTYGAYDMQFRLAGTVETTSQITLAAGASYGGQFLAGVRILQASGIYTNPYRFGDRTALEEIQQHLKAGTSAGLELLGMIASDRQLVVSLKPDESTATLRIGRDGIIRKPNGQTEPPGPALAGTWAILDVPWVQVGMGRNLYMKGVEWRDEVCRVVSG